ncbi:MAG: hypothetical protein RDU89_07040 [bacterium]|nr:hypothetical protein [bacterium]
MNVGELFVRLAMDYSQYDRDERTARSRVTSLGGTLSGIMKNAFSFSLGLGLVQGFRSLSGAVTDFVNTAARTDVLNIAMQSVARSSGYAVDALSEHKQAVMEKGIAEQEATQILTRFMQAQLDTVDAARLARVAQDAAVIAGFNSSQAAEQMTEAIAKQRPELLSAFGMTRNMNDIYADYGRTVGRTAAQLTEAQKKQAMLSYILSEGEKIAGTYEASMGAVGKQISSLPRFWDTLKNAIARPLALPAVSVVVEGITNALRNGIAWAEANQAMLQRWGQSIANAVTMAWRWILGFARSVAAHWSVVRPLTIGVVWAFMTFRAVSIALRGVEAATRTLLLTTRLLKGQMDATSISSIFLRRVVTAYNASAAAGAITSFTFAGALSVLKAAIRAVWTALGPIGWTILAISAVLGIGVGAWNKYSTSVQQAAQKAQIEKMAAQQKAYIESVNKAAAGTNAQADALGDLGKASKSNLQSFDEVHSLMDEMADAAAPSLDMTALGVPELPGLSMDTSDLFADLTGQTEGAKATLSGFFGWLRDRVTGNLAEQRDIWSGILGDVLATWSSWWETVKTKAGDGVAAISSKWAQMRDGVATWWAGITGDLSAWWERVWTNAGETWEGVRSTIADKWNALKTDAPVVWESIKSTIATRWQRLKTDAPVLWEDIKQSISTRFEQAKSSVITAAQSMRDKAPEAWATLLARIREKKDDLFSALTGPWDDAKATILGLIDSAKNWGRNLVDNISDGIREKMASVRDAVNGVADIIKGWLGFGSPTEEGPGRHADRWAPNLMRMYTDGILANLGRVQAAARDVAESLVPTTPMPSPALLHLPEPVRPLRDGGAEVGGGAEVAADAMGQAVYAALRDAFLVERARGGSEDRELVLQVDGQRLARLLIPAIRREEQRTGVRTLRLQEV